ncbi:MAG: hypothetical protein QM820_49410 [Minicystis sp.]
MNETLLQSQIDAAEHQLTLAQQELAEAISTMRAVPRAEKTVTTRRIEDALDKVKVSRSKLGELRSITAWGGAC